MSNSTQPAPVRQPGGSMFGKPPTETLRGDYSDLPLDVQQKLRARTDYIRRTGATIDRSFIEIAKAMVEIHDLLDHGYFTRWVKDEFDHDVRWAERIMTLVTHPVKGDHVIGFSLSVQLELSAPSVPPAAQQSSVKELSILQSQGTSITAKIGSNTVDVWKHQAERLASSLSKATPAVIAVVEHWSVVDYRTVDKLCELERIQERPNSSRTFEEIQLSGFIQPGDSHEAVSIAAEWPLIVAALKIKSNAHASLGMDDKPRRKKIGSCQGIVKAQHGLDVDVTLHFTHVPENLGVGQFADFDIYEVRETI